MIAVIIVISLSNSLGSSKGSSVIYPGELQGQAQASEYLQIQHTRVAKQEYLERMYQNGLISEDFSETKARLDKEFEAYLENEIKALGTVPYFVKVRTTYFNNSLKKAQKENLDIEYMLSDNMQGVYECVTYMYTFGDEEYDSNDVYLCDLESVFKR